MPPGHCLIWVFTLYFPYRKVTYQQRNRRTGKKQAVTWHTAFYDAIRLELYRYRDVLSFEFEHPLNAEPLRIDEKKRGGDSRLWINTCTTLRAWWHITQFCSALYLLHAKGFLRPLAGKTR
jgi:hypothetical protein